MTAKPKEFRYAVELEAGGGLREETGARLEPPEAWAPEHLLLAALVRCSLLSLAYHASYAKTDVVSSAATARALVTRRESDGRYAVVELDVELAVELEPEPDPAALAELLANAERDCFVGASLAAKPRYRWTVAGRAA